MRPSWPTRRSSGRSRTLGATKLPPDALVLEVRATAHSSDLMAAAPTVGRLRDLGVRISLAEVGAPDTGVDALRVLPMDIAVLDTAVTGPLGETRDDVRTTVMLTSLLDAFRQLGVVVTAGGVNDERADERATRLGCILGIGRLFGDWQADPPRLARGRPPGRRPDPQTPTARGRT
ncbi:EAL domain-containing protein [Pseudofrankia sp. BMG5.37]|uniref:EAL domain-containing protein n=1 Tax=Pseudofrankia sp. BMG5.37 TaxID=3050035 RepID=UPI00289A0DDD|nr:EAL domain-containing protein [Pseudofrankia sp. BMG5.37]